MTSSPGDLTDAEKRMLDFAGTWWRFPGAKEDAIRETFDVSPTRFYQRLIVLIGRQEALAYAPVTVKRLRRLYKVGEQVG